MTPEEFADSAEQMIGHMPMSLRIKAGIVIERRSHYIQFRIGDAVGNSNSLSKKHVRDKAIDFFNATMVCLVTGDTHEYDIPF